MLCYEAMYNTYNQCNITASYSVISLYIRFTIFIPMTENEISTIIIGACIEVHKHLGPGLLESAYEVCLAHELINRGLDVNQQVSLPLIYKEVKLNAGYRIDIIVENKVLIEVKSVDALAPIHTAQILTYLKLKEIKLGPLINFNSVKLIDGLKRVVNKL